MKAKTYIRIPLWWPSLSGNWRAWLPSRGNVLFTLLVVGGLLWATSAGALPFRAPTLAGDSTTTISYQGRLADSVGDPVNSSGIGMQFCLYNTDVGGSPLWCEDHPSVPVEDGLFSVLLGSRSGGIPVDILASHSTLWLGITVDGDSEMTPREQIASAPYAIIASSVPDGSITTAKIADEAVTQAKLGSDVSLGPPDGSITTQKLADGAATSRKVALTAKRAYSTSPQSFSQATYTPIDGMSISFTADEIPVDSTLIIDFACTVAGGPWMRSVLYRVYIDDEPVGGEFHSLLYPETDYRNQGSLTELVDVDAGAHTVKIYYRLRVAASEPVGHNRLLRVIVVSQ